MNSVHQTELSLSNAFPVAGVHVTMADLRSTLEVALQQHNAMIRRQKEAEKHVQNLTEQNDLLCKQKEEIMAENIRLRSELANMKQEKEQAARTYQVLKENVLKSLDCQVLLVEPTTEQPITAQPTATQPTTVQRSQVLPTTVPAKRSISLTKGATTAADSYETSSNSKQLKMTSLGSPSQPSRGNAVATPPTQERKDQTGRLLEMAKKLVQNLKLRDMHTCSISSWNNQPGLPPNELCLNTIHNRLRESNGFKPYKCIAEVVHDIDHLFKEWEKVRDNAATSKDAMKRAADAEKIANWMKRDSQERNLYTELKQSVGVSSSLIF